MVISNSPTLKLCPNDFDDEDGAVDNNLLLKTCDAQCALDTIPHLIVTINSLLSTFPPLIAKEGN